MNISITSSCARMEVTVDLRALQMLDSDCSGRLDSREFCSAIKKLVTSVREKSEQKGRDVPVCVQGEDR